MRHRSALAAIALGTAALALAAGARAETSRTVPCEGASYSYRLETPPGNRPRPAILLLHGSGDVSGSFFAAWKQFGAANGIVLIAPRLPRETAFEAVAPAVFRCVVEDAKTAAKIDPKRVYVVGHSMGGYLAYDAAMFDSEYFAAAVVHAAAIDPDYDGILGHARRKIPIAIFIGDRDALVPIAAVRRTRDLLTAAGFPVEYTELAGHDHFYEGLAGPLDAAAWKFLEAHALP